MSWWGGIDEEHATHTVPDDDAEVGGWWWALHMRLQLVPQGYHRCQLLKKKERQWHDQEHDGALLKNWTSLSVLSLLDFKKPTVIAHHCRFLAKTGSDRTNRHWYSGLHCRFISLSILAKNRQWYWVITADFWLKPTLILSLSVRGLNRQWYASKKFITFSSDVQWRWILY